MYQDYVYTSSTIPAAIVFPALLNKTRPILLFTEKGSKGITDFRSAEGGVRKVIWTLAEVLEVNNLFSSRQLISQLCFREKKKSREILMVMMRGWLT